MKDKRSLKLSDNVARQIYRETSKFHPEESGGLLLGWETYEDVVVAGVVQGGPKASRTRYSFHPDHDFQIEELKLAYSSTEGDLDYIGEWHSHPNGFLKPSFIDRRTLMKMDSSKTGAVMLIVSIDDETLKATAWVAKSKWRLAIEQIDVATFTAPLFWPCWPLSNKPS